MSASPSNITSVFGSISGVLRHQDDTREKIRQVRENADTVIRGVQHELVTLHVEDDLLEGVARLTDKLSGTGSLIRAIESQVASEEFYRYSDLWTQQRQTVSMLAVTVEFVKYGKLCDVQRVKQLCGDEDFRLPLEDFLIGICNAVSEFVRLSMNRVIKRDFVTPAKCAVFATHVFEAFRELNFRNDFLRKRYDGIKYDIKRLEEIVYDLTIRGLLQFDIHTITNTTTKHTAVSLDNLKPEQVMETDTDN